jgi:NAD(P)-dependent dehydrogenase (short-subunit alcohol dehydrogenase family)
MNRFTDKVVLVTGAGRGIGKTIADQFAREGASVVIAERDEESGRAAADGLTATGADALFIHVDLGGAAEARRTSALALQHFGRIDVLINNAGGGMGQSMFEITEEMFRKEIDDNVTGLYFLTEAVATSMIPRKSGRIVNISSIDGEGYPTISPAYVAAKGSVNALTWYLAGRLAEHGINVNAICPGSIPTGSRWNEIQTNKARREGITYEEKIAQIARQNPFSRLNSTHDVANAALFLSSDAAENITGQILDVDGGRRSLSGWMVLRALQHGQTG